MPIPCLKLNCKIALKIILLKYIYRKVHIYKTKYLNEQLKSEQTHLTNIQIKKYHITSSPKATLMPPPAICFQNSLVHTCAWEIQLTGA